MRPSLCRSCLAFLLKLLNFLQAFAGVAIVLYSVWMLSQWGRRDSGLRGGLGFDLGTLPDPWFAYLLMGVGVLVCLITFTGHVAAESINGCCLCFVLSVAGVVLEIEGFDDEVSLMLARPMDEETCCLKRNWNAIYHVNPIDFNWKISKTPFIAALVGVLVFDKHWEEDLPNDRTGELNRLRKFVEANIDICKWIGVVVVAIQAFTLLLAIILRGMVSRRTYYYDSDEDLAIARTLLLYPHYSSASASTSMDGKIYSDVWSTRMREKYGLNQGDFSCASVEPKPLPFGNSVGGEDRRLCCIL